MPKQFGPSKEQREREQNEREAKRMWELAECEFDVLKRQRKSEHPHEVVTVTQLIARLERYRDLYFAARGVKKEEESESGS